MPGPKTAPEARRWIREAMFDGRYIPSVHFAERMLERGVDMADVHAVFQWCSFVEPYGGLAKNGGSGWRVHGPDQDRQRSLAIGVEAYMIKGNKLLMLCTVFTTKGRKP
jgi:hypothetical protein